MATLHNVPLNLLPSDWDTAAYSDTTFLAAIAKHAISNTLTDEEVAAMESVTDYEEGEYPDAIYARCLPPMVKHLLFIVTDGPDFPKSASEIRSNLSFPTLDNFCYDTDLLRAQTRNGIDRTEMLANLR